MGGGVVMWWRISFQERGTGTDYILNILITKMPFDHGGRGKSSI